MKQTTNYGLNKPESTDVVDIAILNENADKVDTQMKIAAEHAENEENPHNVTKTQVGLGNVPNVATNDQTPTYTEASTLATLTSGEKLSVAFGKIKKATTALISHIGNKSNPHAVTASQAGAIPTSAIVHSAEVTDTTKVPGMDLINDIQGQITTQNNNLTKQLSGYTLANFAYELNYTASGTYLETDINISDIGFASINCIYVMVHHPNVTNDYVMSTLQAFPYEGTNFVRIGAKFSVNQKYVLSIMVVGVK